LREQKAPHPLVLDTSVAVKFYLPEELDDEAARLLQAAESGAIEFSAPSTLQPEFFNALWQRRRRGELSLEKVREGWADFVSDDPATIYATEDLMPRAAEIVFESGVIVYDALFLTLAEETGTVMVTADRKLLRDLKDTKFARLALSLNNVESII